MNEKQREALKQLQELFAEHDALRWSHQDVTLGDRFDDLVFSGAGGACPVQAEGTYQGDPFYFRYRWGTASLSLGRNPIMNPGCDVYLDYGEPLNGFLNLEEFEKLFAELLELVIQQKAGS